MATAPNHAITSVHAVGRYALGVKWGDEHDSIYPFQSLRRLCPCLDCGRSKAVLREPGEDERKLKSLERLGTASVLLVWGDGHESLFLVEELRDVCGCAACKGEPNYPITNQ